MNDIVRVGMIGVSEGNGHPYSFSSIVNGYDDECLARSGWEGIYNYVRIRDKSEFGIGNLRITHVWTQDESETKKLSEAALIPYPVKNYDDMLGDIDAVIIARDDYNIHLKIARPFLENNLPVFIDKPLSLDIEELKYFKTFLENGKLMSCSGLRYAKEVDTVRGNIIDYGESMLVRGTVLLSWEKYGVHMLEGILSLLQARPISVSGIPASHMSVMIRMSDGSNIQVDALGNVPKIFRVDVIGNRKISTHEISDNFSMFRRMLWHFAEMVKTGKPPIQPHETLDIMKVLIAGNIARNEERDVLLEEFNI
jgi:hypothetical protein